MTRTVAALFGSRAEAEAARTRLASEVDVTWTRMLAKDTAAAIDDLKLDPNQAKTYRNAMQRGDHLLVAKVARGEDSKRIVQALTQPAAGLAPLEPQQTFEVGPAPVPEEKIAPAPNDDVRVVDTAPPAVPLPDREPAPAAAASPPEPQPTPVTQARDELRIGEPAAVRGGARLSSRTGEGAAEDQPLQRGEVGLENPPSGRRVSQEEVEARGLLRERVIEVVEMREEPVIEKEVVVREEVIIRKAVTERAHTIRDTVRRTQVEVDDAGR